MILQALNDIFFWILAFLLAWNAWILIFNKGVPNIRTAPATRRRIIEELQKRAAAHPAGKPFTVVDLGSGHGQFTREIARAMPEARVIGIEVSRKSFFLSERLAKKEHLTNLTYLNEDFFAYDLSGADAVVFYLSSYEMGRVGEKLHRELKEGAFAISNRFRLRDGWVPAETVAVKTPYFFEKEFHVYVPDRRRAA